MKKIVKVASIIVLSASIFAGNAFAGGKKDVAKASKETETVKETSKANGKIENQENDAIVVTEDVVVSDNSNGEENKNKSDKKTSSNGKSITVGSLNGPTSIPIAYLYENKPVIDGYDVNFELCANANIELPKLLKGELDIGFLPANVAAKVFNTSNKSLICLGTAGNGNVSLITGDETFQGLEDLKGKKVAVAGQGATPDYIFRYVVSKNGLEFGEGEGKIDVDYSIPTSELAASVISGKIKYAVVPEPFGTVAVMKGDGVRKAVDFQKEYEKINGEGATYPITLMVARKDFVESNVAAVQKFIESYKEAILWTNKNPTKAGVAVQKNTLGLLAPIVAKSIPSANFVWIDAKDAKKAVEDLLNIFMELTPESVGAKLPENDFYFGL